MVPSKPGDVKNRRSRDRVVAPVGQVPGELRIDAIGKTMEAKAFVHDVSPSGIGLSVESALKIGTAVTLTLECPNPLTLVGPVAWCSQFDVHSIKDGSPDNLPYRAGIKFDDELNALVEQFKRYCESLR